MATYLVLIYGDERAWAAMSEPALQQLRDGHRDLVAAAAAGGVSILGTHGLEPAALATTVHADDSGHPMTTDGPFLETKEAVGGYYLVDADGLDQVLSLVGHLAETRAGHSGVEIRRVAGEY